MLTTKMTVEGVGSCIKGVQRMRNQDLTNFGQGVFLIAKEILKISQQLVPVKTGFLKSTGRIEGIILMDRKNFPVGYLVLYDAPYARFVHDNMDALHAPPTQARFLSDAVGRVRGMGLQFFVKKSLSISPNSLA